jgi:hypothetical protein
LHQAETEYREEVYERHMIDSSDGKVYTKNTANLEEGDFYDSDL